MTEVWPFKITTVNNRVETIMTFPNQAFFSFSKYLSVGAEFHIKQSLFWFCPHKLTKVRLDNTKCSNYILLKKLSRDHRSSNIASAAQCRCLSALELRFNLKLPQFHGDLKVLTLPA